MPRKTKDEIPVYAVYWIDTQKSDEPGGDNSVKPIGAITFGALMNAEDDSISISGEIFEDKTKRAATAIHATAIRRVVKIGTIPSFEKIFGKLVKQKKK